MGEAAAPPLLVPLVAAGVNASADNVVELEVNAKPVTVAAALAVSVWFPQAAKILVRLLTSRSLSKVELDFTAILRFINKIAVVLL
jgi:hypothetical protein